MKLTDEKVKSLLAEDKIVRLKLDSLTVTLTQHNYEEILSHLGDWVNKDWEMEAWME